MAARAGPVPREIKCSSYLNRCEPPVCRMLALPKIDQNPPGAQAGQPDLRRSRVTKAQRGFGGAGRAELEKATETVPTGSDMLYTSIGKRDPGRLFRIEFQECVVHTIRGGYAARPPAGAGFYLSEEPLFRIQSFLDHYRFARQSQAYR
jgi:hypothetical protein